MSMSSIDKTVGSPPKTAAVYDISTQCEAREIYLTATNEASRTEENETANGQASFLTN